jgi:hypothetical protein
MNTQECNKCPFRKQIPRSRRYMCDAIDELCPHYIGRIEFDYKKCEIYNTEFDE